MKEAIKAKLEELEKKMDNLSEKTKDSLDTAKIKAMYAKDEMKEKIEEKKKESKGNIAALKENLRLSSEKAKGKATAELIKAQMNIDVAKTKIAEKKEALNKAQMEDYINETFEYADACIEISLLAAEEAQLAILEAMATEAEYEKKYGNQE